MSRYLITALACLLAMGCSIVDKGHEQSEAPLELSAMALWAPWSPPLRGYAARESTWDRTGGNVDAIRIDAGETATLFDHVGPGIIRHIWITNSAPEPAGRTTVIRMYWDGAEEPAVEVPLGDFFAVGHGLYAEVHSFPITVNAGGRAYNCWWPMPFSEDARITVTNESTEPIPAFYCYVEYLDLDSPPPTRERFHAQYRQAYPIESSENYVILETEGQGTYVGTVYSIESTEPSWWGEGDDLIQVDDREPMIGTGTEDYLCDAWGIREYHQLWHGAPVVEGYNAPDLRTTAYRWHILDPIPFYERIRVSIEHGVANRRQDHMSSVAFWYQIPPASPFPELPAPKERLEGRVSLHQIRAQVPLLALSGEPDAVERIGSFMPHADEYHACLIRGMAAYAQGLQEPTSEHLAALDEAIRDLGALLGDLPEEELFSAPEINRPTDSDQPVPSEQMDLLRSLRRVRHDLARRCAVARGHLELGEEILVESRDPRGELTPPPLFESTEDWTYSYAKVEDERLIGQGAHFTRGGTDPSWARFTPDLPQDGTYEVLVTFSYGANAGDTRFEVRHADGMETIDLPQRGRPGTPDRNNAVWHSLGTFRFEAGQSAERGSVTLNAAPGEDIPNSDFEYRAYADSVRFVLREG